MEERLNRSDVLRFRVNPVERAAAEALSERAARKPSEFLRELLRREAAAHGLLGAPASMTADDSSRATTKL